MPYHQSVFLRISLKPSLLADRAERSFFIMDKGMDFGVSVWVQILILMMSVVW